MRRATVHVITSVAITMALPVSATTAQEKRDSLSQLMKALETHKEPKRESVFALPQAVKILESEPKEYKGEIRFRGLLCSATS
jgi:hypothetical protein